MKTNYNVNTKIRVGVYFDLYIRFKKRIKNENRVFWIDYHYDEFRAAIRCLMCTGIYNKHIHDYLAMKSKQTYEYYSNSISRNRV